MRIAMSMTRLQVVISRGGDVYLSNVKMMQIRRQRRAVKLNLDIVKMTADISLMGKTRKNADVRSRQAMTPGKAIAWSPAKPGGRRQRRVTPYHHGALREALLMAAEGILERDGMPGLTLRAAAREAGVSHAAPTHHFSDLTGLLSELAAVGFRRFGEMLLAAADRETEPAS